MNITYDTQTVFNTLRTSLDKLTPKEMVHNKIGLVFPIGMLVSGTTNSFEQNIPNLFQLSFPLFDSSDNRACQQRNHELVMPGKRVTLSSDVRRAFDDVFLWPIMLDHVEIRRGKMRYTVSQVPRNCQGFEENLR
jgi:hypothetical protein